MSSRSWLYQQLVKNEIEKNQLKAETSLSTAEKLKYTQETP